MNQNPRKKILYVITKANWGGAQRYVYDLATALPTAEFEVVVAFGQPGLLGLKLQEAGILTHAIAALERDVLLSADLRSFFELFRLFRQKTPDIVHLNSSKAAGLGALAARLAGVPKIVFTAHGWPFEESRNGISRGLIYLFSWITAIFSHDVIVVSQKDFRIGKQMPFCAHKMLLIHNGIDFSMSFGSGEVIRDAFPAGVHITGTVGELTKNKNQISLIERARYEQDTYVAIVGEGEDRPFLESKIKEYKLQDRVKLFGFIPADQVMKGFDMFALPSVKEGLPYVVLEARAACLPIEHTMVGGIPDILEAKNELAEFSLGRMVQKTTALYRT